MATQTKEATKFTVSIEEEDFRFLPYWYSVPATKAEIEAVIADAGDQVFGFAWTSDTTAEWYSREQDEDPWSTEGFHYLLTLEELDTTTNSLLEELTYGVADFVERFGGDTEGDYDAEDWEGVSVRVYDDSFFFVTADGTYGSVKGLRIVPAGDSAVPGED